MRCGVCVLPHTRLTRPHSARSVDAQRAPPVYDDDVGYVTLRGGARMPRVGFGTAGLGDGTGAAVRAALAAGYRLLDSAQAREWYREDLAGEALHTASVPRTALFLTTKVHPRHLGRNATAARLAVSLRELRTDYIDLMLLHYPECWGDLCGGVAPEGTWRDGWRALEAMHATGVVRALGVSNFDAAQLEQLMEWARVPPAVVQAHSDPFNQARTPVCWACCASRVSTQRADAHAASFSRTGSCSARAASTASCSKRTARWACSGGAATSSTRCSWRPRWQPRRPRTAWRPRRLCCAGRSTATRRVVLRCVQLCPRALKFNSKALTKL